ncbi:hypothetical protein CC2G_006151 [Coprinopsis cinerea AmutBmut pab1-1]|nr:hypothetical protein CC2G_006151 [Coprinopsis cinerea AmutBmut pab1-1]
MLQSPELVDSFYSGSPHNHLAYLASHLIITSTRLPLFDLYTTLIPFCVLDIATRPSGLTLTADLPRVFNIVYCLEFSPDDTFLVARDVFPGLLLLTQQVPAPPITICSVVEIVPGLSNLVTKNVEVLDEINHTLFLAGSGGFFVLIEVATGVKSLSHHKWPQTALQAISSSRFRSTKSNKSYLL